MSRPRSAPDMLDAIRKQLIAELNEDALRHRLRGLSTVPTSNCSKGAPMGVMGDAGALVRSEMRMKPSSWSPLHRSPTPNSRSGRPANTNGAICSTTRAR